MVVDEREVGRTIVTGGASGIGRSCALRQAALGEEVHVWDLDRDGARAVAAEVVDAGGRAEWAEVDVADLAGTRAALEAFLPDRRPTGLVHAAGLMRTVPFDDVDVSDYDRILEVNLRGTFFLVQAAATVIEDGGALVLFSSVSGRRGRPLAAPYAASKAAVISVAQSAALAFGPALRINAVAPGVIETPMMRQIAAEREEILGTDPDQPYPGLVESLALKRLGTPDDVARVVEFLLGPLSAYVSGQTINVDGGMEFD